MEPYPMKWFRMYDELLNDPKVQKLPDAAFRCWVNLLCLANKGKPRGRFQQEDIGYALRMEDKRADKMVAYFLEHGLLEWDGEFLMPHGWDSRQFASDNVTERTRKHRTGVPGNVPGNGAEGFPGTPPEQNRDRNRNRSRADTPPTPPLGGTWVSDDQAFDAFWRYVIRKEPSRAKAREAWDKARAIASAADIIAGLERWLPVWEQFEDATKIPHITTWLNQQRWTVEHPTAPGEEPRQREREPKPAPPPPTPEQLAQRRQREQEHAATYEASKAAREQEAIAAAARDPTRPPTISPERWASLLPDVRRKYAM